VKSESYFAAIGERMQWIGEEEDSLEELLKPWEAR
jgi:hypothetical protein